MIILAWLHWFHWLYYCHDLSTSNRLHYLSLKSQGRLSHVLTYPSILSFNFYILSTLLRKFSLLNLSWLALLCINCCCTAKWSSYTCTYILLILSVTVYHERLNMVPCIYSRALLFIPSLYNSLHLLIPNSQSIPPSTPPHPWQPQICSLCLWVCFFFIDNFICFTVYPTYE